MYIKQLLLTACCLSIYGSVHAQAPKLIEQVSRKGNEMVIPYQKYLLPNGLTVILTEDHSDPLVHVDVTYHVGSAREEIGKSGFAHFFEHMMFEGTDHIKSGDHFKTVTASGGTLNGTTSLDRTNYFETVPSNQLQKMLWLEADRMGFLLDAVTQPKFEIQRSTVKNERGQNYDNRPYGLASEAMSKAMYPYGHPYSWLTIGYTEDLNKVDVTDLKRFFLRWYGPNNATLTIGGDIDSKQTLTWVTKYFGSIPRGPEVRPTVLPAPTITADRYVSYTDNYARQPLLMMAYPGVKMYTRDQAALDALVTIIGRGTNSLLYKNFVKTRKAVQASMYSENSELAGVIGIQIVPFPGQSLAEMQQLVKESLKEFEQRGVTDDDMARFKGRAEADFINAVTSVSGKVTVLAAAQTYTGNPNQIGRELDDIRKVSKADIMRVYEQYLKGKAGVILSVLPRSGEIKPAAADNYSVNKSDYKAPDYGYAGLTYHKATDNFDRMQQPPAGPNPSVKVPPFWTGTTPNGIKLIGAYNQETPQVSITIAIRGGGLLAANAPAKAGLPGIVSQMLNEDTRELKAEEFSSQLGILGSSIRVSANGEETVFNLNALTSKLDATLALLKQRLFHPKFTEEALERIKKQNIQSLTAAKGQPANIASTVFNKLLYGKDNIMTFGLNGTEETIKNISLTDVQAYYEQYFTPDLCSVVIVGELNESAAKNKLAFLNSWPAKKVVIPEAVQPVAKPVERTIYYVHVPNAAQSEIRIGYYTGIKYDPIGLSYKLGLANYMLGGGFSSRLNIDLREEKGWTYGASSGFSSGRTGGYFMANTGVKAPATDSAVIEMLKDIRDYAAHGITAADLEFTKSSIGQSDALRYETNAQKASFLSRIQSYGLTADYVNKQNQIMKDLQISEVNTLAKQYLDADKMTILVVGDRSRILPGLQQAGYRLVELDTDANLKN